MIWDQCFCPGCVEIESNEININVRHNDTVELKSLKGTLIPKINAHTGD